MTLYKCKECRNWHSGVAHVCGPKMPELRDQRTLEQAVVRAARAVEKWSQETPSAWNLRVMADLRRALIELDGLDRPLEGK